MTLTIPASRVLESVVDRAWIFSGVGSAMKILVANPRGFCAGVNMAIECLDETIRMFGPNVYVYHEIVHNKHVVDRFSREGVTFVDVA